jgi:hypothetical protein
MHELRRLAIDNENPIMDIIRYLGSVLAPPSHCSILIETPMAGEDG